MYEMRLNQSKPRLLNDTSSTHSECKTLVTRIFNFSTLKHHIAINNSPLVIFKFRIFGNIFQKNTLFIPKKNLTIYPTRLSMII